MTSQQLKAKLDAAIAIISECERVLEDTEKAARRMDDVALKHRVSDFMQLHRDEQREGGQP